MLDLVERQIERADVYLTDGRENFDAADAKADVQAYQAAATYLHDAQPHYRRACESLSEGYLAAAAKSRAGAASDAVGRLQAAGAADAGLTAWAELQRLLPGLAPPAENLAGCARTKAQLERIHAVEAVSAATSTADSELEAAWPRLADEARAAALQAREMALEPSVDVREYRIAVREGKRALVRGDIRLEKSDHRAARDAFQSSREAFLEATALREATGLDTEVNPAEQEES
jgi:hypothetical protein